ncbi:unnamed protein product [Rotaria magnacalcarata]|uniref:MARVEL domain-containing protein n=1 Tax=Rotaria magnacalcarata TaxID=392030 RepID=A0A819PSZ9_9BILA|nr:unnamed protein product [Rotaria magnacalcarata]CAF4018035.1 unnamed protein product [Rotaria magnacalcarata]
MSGSSSGFCNQVVDYIKSVPGILKMIELAIILCGAAPTIDGSSGNKGFFLFVSILALILTFALFIIFIFNINTWCPIIPWKYTELGWCAFIALFYFIASIVIATIAKYDGAYGGATFFGFAAFLTYTAEAVYHFLKIRGELPSTSADRYNASQQPTNN